MTYLVKYFLLRKLFFIYYEDDLFIYLENDILVLT